ncbi:unnamed protein product [Chilo suppressalis]|uniref:LRRCT domain-containing protein n=1 Tax=Chilo suppressalis TaxID=168631 RepID=A0ABN8AXI7_CHISP|nr:unnamed protein product [Chilo suppressalis]
MALWKIIAFMWAVSVYAESKWDYRHKREILTSICDPVHNNTNKVQCYCGRLSHHPDQIGTAECYQTANNLTLNDPGWEKFKILQNVSRLTLTNTRGIAMNYIPTNALIYTKAILRLDVKYCNIENIHQYAFANLSLVEELTLRDNQIKMMVANSFAHHVRLKTISLDQNNIAEINRNVFVDLPSLEQLFLTANKITTIHDKAFVHLTNLKELEIDKNKIFSLNSETFSGLRNLQKLELSGNNLEVVGDNTFAPLVNLRFLNLGDNKIQMLDEKAFNGLSRLQVLSLENNKLSTLANEKVFEGLQSLTSLSLKNNEVKAIKPEVILPILSNFYGKTSLLNIEGNRLDCNCQIDVFKPLLNKTQNVRLSIDLQNLQCYPSEDIKRKWDKAQESVKNSGQVFEDVEPQGESAAYEYYDDTELNGTLFYFDMRFILNCSGEEKTTPSVTEISLAPTTLPAHVATIKDLNIKISTSPTSGVISTTIKPITMKHILNEIDNKGTLDLSKAATATGHSKISGKFKHDDNNNKIHSDNKELLLQDGKYDNKSDKKDTVYTTTRLATVSAKPIENKQYENMASDEAKPDRLKSHRNIEEEMEDPPKFKSNNAHRDEICILFVVTIVFNLGLLL